jgi:hypothetical protein
VLAAAALEAGSVFLELGKTSFAGGRGGFAGNSTFAGAGAAATISSYTTSATSFLIPLAVWAASTLIIHLDSRLMRGKGGLRSFYAMNGVAYLPILLQSLLSIVDVSTSPTIPRSAVSSDPLLGVLLGQFNVLNLVSLGLSAVAVMANYGLNRKRAVLAVLIPVLIFLALGLVTTPLGVAPSRGGSPSPFRFGFFGFRG